MVSVLVSFAHTTARRVRECGLEMRVPGGVLKEDPPTSIPTEEKAIDMEQYQHTWTFLEDGREASFCAVAAGQMRIPFRIMFLLKS